MTFVLAIIARIEASTSSFLIQLENWFDRFVNHPELGLTPLGAEQVEQ